MDNKMATMPVSKLMIKMGLPKACGKRVVSHALGA